MLVMADIRRRIEGENGESDAVIERDLKRRIVYPRAMARIFNGILPGTP